MIVAINQYGDAVILKTTHPRKELMDLYEAKTATKLYKDTKGGKSKHIGYLVYELWFTFYNITEWEGK